ncbi:uncharacterized protein LOC129918357 [Episyrphus balteatus]|uniref:uncharacterized protein LOC129918357 n=1 Tax=Episyrphus balteatus TaxID=286459 RepID=UPI00248608A8|nr:uncharacterized protein LOC129918357 [Episyrphus balteatus]XP_055854808.1 uncharacterized protein LOC129918357 [Episyrphus balteatus]XP_055854809.1 uncharacterized protein LOC129918357 [Episyrphus balteatus]
MVGIDPSDIGKHQKLIKIAQEDMSQIDVLVCGRCLGVFHFVEEFKDHKRFACDKETQIRDGPDTKPKIWAFLLWKASQLNNKDNNNSSNNSSFNSNLTSGNNQQQNSWALYQTWVKMEESIRETWIVAGKTIQSFAKMGHGGLQEMPVKITKTVVDNANTNPEVKKPTVPLSKPILTNVKPPIVTKKQDEENDLSPIRSAVVKKPPLPVQQVPNKLVTSTPIQRVPNRRAKRTIPNANGETEEEVVEKIVAKRFNPRRKMHEYLVKWESCSHEHNTWEPQVHLENVPQILETFEKQLARQKEQRAAQQAKQQAASLAAAIKVVDLKKDVIKDPNKIEDTPKLNLSSPGSDSSRLSRTSKSKALDQVKQWCADEAVEQNTPSTGATSMAATPVQIQTPHPVLPPQVGFGGGGGGSNLALKRKLDDSDFDDSAMIGDEDLEEDLIPSHTVKRMKNGDTVSVKVETKNERAVESKVIKVNGNIKNPPTSESFSADVIITQDTQTSGVVKKAGFNGATTNNSSPKTEAHIRLLSRGETNSGIVRMGSEAAVTLAANTIENGPVTNNQSPTSAATAAQSSSSPSAILNTIHRTQMNKSLPTNPLSSIGNIQITQVQQSSNTMRSSSPRLINSQTTIARTTSSTTSTGGYHHQQQQTRIQQNTPKTVQTNTRVLQSQPRTATIAQRKSQSPGIQQTSPTSGKMIIPRGKVANTTQPSPVMRTQTPEQKILQLSKSGDLKVTKKIMSKETTTKQHQLARSHQSQVQIQKVQQIAPPTRHVGAPKQKQSQVKTAVMDVSSFNSDEHQPATLCPITGKILGHVEGTEMHEEQQQHHQITTMQSGVLQTQLLTTADHHQQQQHHEQADFQEMEQSGNLLQLAGDQQLMTNEDGSPLLVTGEDGTVYQVAGKNAEGQTILVAQGADGEQQFAYVAAADGDENNVLTLDNAVAEAVAQLSPEQQAEALAAAAAESGQYILKQDDGHGGELVSMSEANEMNPAQQGQLCIQTGSESGESQDQNIPAEVVQADLPSPGGTRRVVLLLQDGTFMITQMQDDEYKSLNIAS